MITEDYVSFEIANLLKEKGFNEPTPFVYNDKKEVLRLSSYGIRDLTNEDCGDYSTWQFPIEGASSIVSAPTLNVAMKWLREIHNLAIELTWEHTWFASITKMSSMPESVVYEDGNRSYEESCKNAIKYCLENLI